MSNEVIKFSEKSNSSFHWLPEDVLVEALKRVRSGEWEGRRKIIVLSVDDTEGSFTVSELQSGMRLSQEITVLEFAKHSILKEMMG